MPRKPKPQAATLGSLVIPDGRFGETIAVSAPQYAGKWLRYAIQAATGAEVATVPFDASGNATIGCGPTPSWSSGGGTGTAYALEFPDELDRTTYTVLSDVVHFTVLP